MLQSPIILPDVDREESAERLESSNYVVHKCHMEQVFRVGGEKVGK